MREPAEVHAAHLAEFETRLACLKTEAKSVSWQPSSPWFGIYAVLLRGVGCEREYRD